MRVRHADRNLEKLETDPRFTAGFGQPVIKGFRKVMAWIRDADSESDLYAMKSLHYEKLKGKRSHQRSLRVNDQFRLIVEIDRSGPDRIVVIRGVEDYH
jgi:proteic killer suppression protein